MGRPFPDQPLIARDIVHVVSCPLNESPPAAVDLLDDRERQQAERLVFDRDRRRYINAHAYLRTVLARCVGRPAVTLRFITTAYGKPSLIEADNPQAVRFNMSHSGERALVAVTSGREVGVDIEEEKPISDLIDLARRFFAPGEVAELISLPDAARSAAFFRCWTRKEAVVKAVGEGLSYPLDGFEVPLDASCGSQELVVGGLEWRVVSLPVDVPYVAALAAAAGDWRIERWDAPVDA